MFVTEAGEHGSDMPVLPVERSSALRIVPSQRRQAALDGRRRLVSLADPEAWARDVEADDLSTADAGTGLKQCFQLAA